MKKGEHNQKVHSSSHSADAMKKRHPSGTVLAFYAENPDLLGAQQVQVASHMERCIKCQETVAQLQALDAAYKRLRQRVLMSERTPECLSDEDAADYVAGEMPRKRKVAVEQHLNACLPCSYHLNLLRAELFIAQKRHSARE